MANFGETLKRERELRKITLREVSEATKIGLRYLEALEANRFERLPGGLFNKGFIRAYAKFIGLDPEGLVNAYLYETSNQQHPQPERPRYTGLSLEEVPPFLLPVAEPLPARRRWMGPALAAGAAAVLLAGFLLMMFREDPPELGTAAAPAVPPPRQASVSAEVPPPPVPADPGPEVSPAPSPSSERPDPPPTTRPATETREDAGSGPWSRPWPAPEPESPPDRVLSLSLTVSEPTWIAITCDGVERINKEIPTGNTLALSCDGNVLLSTGNAGTMTLRIDGNECVPLGARGAVIHDLLLNRDRAGDLCPPSAGSPDA